MARQKLSISEILVARRAEAIGRGPGAWKEAPDPKIGVGGMAKPLNQFLNERNPCYLTRRSHWDGSWTLKKTLDRWLVSQNAE